MFVTTKFRDVAKYPHVIVGYVLFILEHTRQSKMEEQDVLEDDEKAIREATSEDNELVVNSPETPKKEDIPLNSPQILVPEKTLKRMFKYVLKEANSIRESAAKSRKGALDSVENHASFPFFFLGLMEYLADSSNR